VSEGTCPVCGAPRVAAGPCPYCRTGSPAFSLGELASVTRRDASTLDSLLPTLARALEEALPGQVEVQRAGGLMRRDVRVRSIQVTVGEQRFTISRSGRETRTSILHRVRGIDLRHEEPPAPVWVDRLAESLLRHSATSVDVGPALLRLISH
jgi:hypothetical protein